MAAVHNIAPSPAFVFNARLGEDDPKTHTAHCCPLLIGRNAAHHETVAMHPVPDMRSSMLRSRNDRSQGGRFPPPV